VLAGVVAVACADLGSLTSGAPPSADGSTPRPDGTIDASRAGDARVDGAMDASPVDAGRDAGGDRGITEAACPGYPDAIFCDDFDHGPFGARWTSESVLFGSVSASDAQVVSAPLALFAEIDDGGSTGEGLASLDLKFAQAFSRIRNSYDIYFDQIGARSAAIGSVYHIAGSTSYFGLYLFAHGGPTMEVVQEGSLPDGGEEFLGTMFPGIPLRTWTRIILDVDFGALTFTLSRETPPGATPDVVIPSTPIEPTIAGTSSEVIGGIEYVVFPETTGWRVYVDNVVIETP
jgi:hypothetical protein